MSQTHDLLRDHHGGSVTTVERDALETRDGLTVWNSDDEELQVWNDTAGDWESVTGAQFVEDADIRRIVYLAQIVTGLRLLGINVEDLPLDPAVVKELV